MAPSWMASPLVSIAMSLKDPMYHNVPKDVPPLNSRLCFPLPGTRPFVDLRLLHLYWLSSLNKPPACNPSFQSLLSRELDLRYLCHLLSNNMSYTVQGKARPLLLCIDPFSDPCLIRMKSLANYLWCYPLSNFGLSAITPTSVWSSNSTHRPCLETFAFALLWFGCVLCQIIFLPPSLSPF